MGNTLRHLRRRVSLAALVTATLLTLGTLSAAPAGAATLAPTGSLTGTVSQDAGGTVSTAANVSVAVGVDPEFTSYLYGGLTDAVGHFTITGISPGTYVVMFGAGPFHHGGPSQNLVPQVFQNIQIGAGSLVTLTPVLHPGAVTAGTVTTNLAGVTAPAPFVRVTATPTTDPSAYIAVMTDSEGRYTINQLAAGNYTVAFHDYANTSLIPEFYDNAYDVASATPVTVGTTSSVSGIDDELSDVVSPVSRLSGADRYATSAAISAATFPVGVAVAYIANGGNFPDALSAAPVAGKDDSPVLLVTSDSIPAAIQTELTRLQPLRIVILGGLSTISSTVEAALQPYTAGVVTRTSGPDRYATSAAISSAAFTPGVDVVYIANGKNFPDALSGAPVAGTKNAPVLLVPGDDIPDVIRTELTRLKPASIVVLGGVNAISPTVFTAMQSYTAGTVTRSSGTDRFATSAAISRATFTAPVAVVYIANAYNFPDALSGAPVAALQSAPVLLVPSDSIPAAIQAELTRLHPARIVVLGGVNAVSKAVAQQLLTFIGK